MNLAQLLFDLARQGYEVRFFEPLASHKIEVRIEVNNHVLNKRTMYALELHQDMPEEITERCMIEAINFLLTKYYKQ
jgi:hypothetical protein